MPPSHTVENYLKVIYQAQIGLPGRDVLVPTGQLSSALGVVPGTATSMVKALAEGGLVHYEPYLGVRLTAAGERLAALVLRRHRLVELFLVEVMGMGWAEVHDEAEQLEHAVSDRLIERIDSMLGRPSVDPHGDPIPGPEGAAPHGVHHTLLTSPLRTPLRVRRVINQDARFLRFVEQSDLKPGQIVEVEERDAAADSVRVKAGDDRRVTLGARAASKLLVETALLVISLLAGAVPARAQGGPPAAVAAPPFGILDNSFLVEEAFNQEPGIFQNIFTLLRHDSEWEATFTQEWPLGSQRHQLSYTLPLQGVQGASGLGDILLNYRYQALREGPGRPAFAPRLTVIIPSGSARRGLGTGTVGLQINLPFSKQRGDLYWHWNAGVTLLPRAETSRADRTGSATLTSPHLAASAIWRLRPLLNLLVETVLEFEETIRAAPSASVTARDTTLVLAPGLRGGWNIGTHQVITGLAVPVVIDGDATRTCVFGYLSYELPFTR